MHKTTRWISMAMAVAITGAIFLGLPPTVSAQRRGSVVVVTPVPVYDPFFPYWGYPYGPGPYYAARNYGYVKVNTHGQNAEIYVDGGYAAKTHKSKKLAMRPGNHEIELRDSGGRSLLKEKVAVMIGETVKVDVPS
jgi:PEGA domain-containing protein